MKVRHLLSLLTLCAIVFTSCQQKETTKPATVVEAVKEVAHHPEVEKTIQLYFDGWMTGDTSLVGQAMHSTCHLKYFRDGKFSMRDRTQYLSGFKLRERRPGYEGRIISMDVTNNIASAKCEIETPDRIFTDYFNMQEIDGRWYIVDKVSTNRGKG